MLGAPVRFFIPKWSPAPGLPCLPAPCPGPSLTLQHQESSCCCGRSPWEETSEEEEITTACLPAALRACPATSWEVSRPAPNCSQPVLPGFPYIPLLVSCHLEVWYSQLGRDPSSCLQSSHCPGQSHRLSWPCSLQARQRAELTETHRTRGHQGPLLL